MSQVNKLSVNTPVPEGPGKNWFVVHRRDAESVRQVIARLYSERSFGVDEMRDLAQKLNAAFDNLIPYE